MKPMAPPPPNPARDAKTRSVILWIGAIVLVLGGYGSGLGQGMRTARKAHDAQVKAEGKLGIVQRQLNEKADQVRLLESRRQLDHALEALDKRDHRTAANRVFAAALLLGNAGKDSGSADTTALAKEMNDSYEQARAGKTAPDPAILHQRIEGWVAALDKIVPSPYEPSSNAHGTMEAPILGGGALPIGTETPADSGHASVPARDAVPGVPR